MLLCFVAWLSGCAEAGLDTGAFVSRANKTDAEIKLEDSARQLSLTSRNIVLRNTFEGAAIGAAIGCLGGLLTGGDAGDCAAGAAVGGVVGGVAGNQVGQQAAAANTELVDRDQTIQKLRGVSKQLTVVEADLGRVLRAQNAELRSLRKQLEEQKVTQSQYDARVRAINSNRSAVSNALLRSESRVDQSIVKISDARSQGQGGLSSTLSQARRQKNRLARARETISTIN